MFAMFSLLLIILVHFSIVFSQNLPNFLNNLQQIVSMQSGFLLPQPQTLLKQINLARTNPQTWIDLIQTKYNNSYFGTPSDIEECIHYLGSVSPLPPLEENQGLDFVAQRHAGYLKNGWGDNPYAGCNGSTIDKRIKKVGTWNSALGENVAGGQADPEALVALWLIDSNSSTKGHRANIMHTKYHVLGIGISSNKNQSNNPTIVIDFAGGFTCNGDCPQPAPFNKLFNCTTKQFQDDQEPSEVSSIWSEISIGLNQSSNITLPSKTSLFDVINQVRTDSKSFAKVVSSKYNSSQYGSYQDIQNAVDYLNAFISLDPLNEVQGLDATSQLQANYLIDNIFTDPTIGCFNTTPQDRIKIAGIFQNTVGENVLLSNFSNPEEIVASWIINPGNQYKQYRDNIMNPYYTSLGIGLSSNQDNSQWNTNIIVDFAINFQCNQPCPTIPQTNQKFNCSQFIGLKYMSNYALKTYINSLVLVFTILSILFFKI